MRIARYLPRFRRAYRALSMIEARESFSRKQIEQYQLGRINELWSSAVTSVPHYRRLFNAGSLPTRFDGLDQFTQILPILEKSQLRDSPEDFLAADRGAGTWHRTGGSTGVPLRLFRTHDAHCRMLWQKYRMEQAWGLDFFDRKAFVWGHAASFAPGIRGTLQRAGLPWLDWLRNRIRLNAYSLSQSDLVAYLQQIVDRKVQVLYGYSSAIDLLAKEAERLSLKFPHLKLAILTAEPADAAMLQQCKRGFGAPAAIEYGSVECGIIATGMPDDTLRVREDAVLLETEPRSDGRYDLIVTVLDNPAYPLFRYRIGDVTDEIPSHPESGFAVLKNVSGRSNDLLFARSGRAVHPLAVKHAVEQHDHVRRFTAHQNDNGHVLLTIEAPSTVDVSDFDNARRGLEVLLDDYPVHVKVLPEIPANQAGKHRWVTSEMLKEEAK